MNERQIEIVDGLLRKMAEKDGLWDIDNMLRFSEREFNATQQEFSKLKIQLLLHGFIEDPVGENYRFSLTSDGWEVAKIGVVKHKELSKSNNQEIHHYHNSVINTGTNTGSMAHTINQYADGSNSTKKSKILKILLAIGITTISTVIADYISTQFNIFFY